MATAVHVMEGPVRGLLASPGRLLNFVDTDSGTSPSGDALERRAINAVKTGDGNAYDYLVSKYMRRVVSVAWGIVRDPDEAEDLAQEAFVKAYLTIGRFKADQPFGPWIFRIVTNLALDVIKHRRRFQQQALSESQQAPRRDTADLQADSNELARRIDEAMRSLPEMQGIVARLYLVEQFDHGEIAGITGLTEGTVRSHLSLARRKLKDQLSDLYGEDDE
jgi:RNA polymerase sigma-70 factor, ECF subfamily